MIKTCLCLVVDSSGQKVLMIHKKRGQGEGKLNFPGGKVLENESTEEATVREVFEETGVAINHLKFVGKLEFLFSDPSKDWNNLCFVYEAKFESGELRESPEAFPFWQNINEIPLEKMWKADEMWISQWKSHTKFSFQITYSETHEILNIKRQELNF